jgi:type IV secretory pathway VirB4 component
VVVNRWNSPHIVNRNAVLIGPSGSGKSFFINGEVTQILNQGNHVFMIDIGHSYLRNARYENAKYFDSSKISEFNLNMFLCDKDENGYYQIWGEDEESKFDDINKVFSILTVIWKGSKEYADGEDILLKEIIKYFYNYVNDNKQFPDVDTFYEYIDIYESEVIKDKDRKFIDLDSLRLALRDYLKGGMYGDLLNARESINIASDRFIVFDLESVSKSDKKLFSIISVIIIDIILSKIKKLKGVRKTLIIDEALDFLLDARMSEFIAYLYRTVRKKDGQVIIATQDAGFFKSLPEIIRNSILRQSDTKILLNHNNSPDSFRDLVSLGIIAPKHLPMLKSLKSTAGGREFLIIQGDKPMVLLNEVSWYAGLVYTSIQWDVVNIDELADKYKNIDMAIREYHDLSVN